MKLESYSMVKQVFLLFTLYSCCIYGDTALQISSGVVKFSGDLSNKTVFSKSFQIRFFKHQFENTRYFSFFSIDTIQQEVVQTKDSFPFGKNSKLNNLNFLFIINTCMKLNKNIDHSFGLGQGTVNVNSKTIRRDYGSWNYQYLLDYEFHRKWKATFMLKYVGKVEQKNFDKESSFAFWGPFLGLTYRL